MDLKKAIRNVPDWPLKNVIFRDLTTLMQEPLTFKYTCDILYKRYKNISIDKIVGIDARGFVFGAVLAYKLDIGFVPVRKKGKLPFKTIEQSYCLEYGKGTLEIHEDAINKGENVVIVDDLIATGGTIGASVDLVKKLGGNIIECAFVVELIDLNGKDKIKDCKIFSITQFEGE